MSNISVSPKYGLDGKPVNKLMQELTLSIVDNIQSSFNEPVFVQEGLLQLDRLKYAAKAVVGNPEMGLPGLKKHIIENVVMPIEKFLLELNVANKEANTQVMDKQLSAIGSGTESELGSSLKPPSLLDIF